MQWIGTGLERRPGADRFRARLRLWFLPVRAKRRRSPLTLLAASWRNVTVAKCVEVVGDPQAVDVRLPAF